MTDLVFGAEIAPSEVERMTVSRLLWWHGRAIEWNRKQQKARPQGAR